MVALLSTPHDYLVAFVIACFVIVVCLGLLAVLGVVGLVARWDVRRRHPEWFPERIVSERAEPCEKGVVIAEHRVLKIRHRVEDEIGLVA